MTTTTTGSNSLPFEPHTPAEPIATIRPIGGGVWEDSRGYRFLLIHRSQLPEDFDCTDSNCPYSHYLEPGFSDPEIPHPDWYFRDESSSAQPSGTDALLHVDHFTALPTA